MSATENLARTYVDIAPVTNGLATVDHQVVYGRRGTGKTHTLQHLAHELEGQGDLPIYLDLRRIGSANGIYGDPSQGVRSRGTRLLIDVLEAVHSELLLRAIEDDRFGALLEFLDPLADAAAAVRVQGTVSATDEHEIEDEDSRLSQSDASIALSPRPTAAMSSKREKRSAQRARRTQKSSYQGVEEHFVHFGILGRAISDATTSIEPSRLWILLDEWSSVPLDLQPLLADLLRRTFFTIQGLTVKIGATERRSRFVERRTNAAAGYVGLELGSDTAAALDLDEHLLMQEDGDHAQMFFSELIFKHIQDLLRSMDKHLPGTTNDLIAEMFSHGALKEWVRSAGGVPRDAINILGLAASRAGDRRISLEDVQLAARQFYLRDKEASLAGNPKAERLWGKLQSEIVLSQRSRTFLVRRVASGPPESVLDLYDARLIHLLRQGLRSNKHPGQLFDGYAVDYGTYIDAMARIDLENAWSAASTPWVYQRGQAVLPDTFDSRVIIDPR
ncbi:ATP-binding protein [Nocardioides sp. YIM 152588]|uniref:ATP-binding protein n=1 Tax=Nocardioides sp. YIM 152588 TaxID=3158259 RepID=UPI0032E39EAE